LLPATSSAIILPLLTGPSGGALRDDYTSVGFSFTVGSNDLTVKAVGVWDYLGDGQAPYNIPVTISGVGTFIVPADPTHTLTFDGADGFRYFNVTPFILTAGSSHDMEATYANNGGELWHDSGAVTANAYQASPLITNIVSTFGGGNVASAGQAFSGPELLISVPEPASFATLAALGSLSLLRRKRS
jgi:hypothetical protein